MKENNDILIITEDKDKRDNIFRYISSIIDYGFCTYCKSSYDIKTKDKHIKITSYRDDFCNPIDITNNNPDTIIIDNYMDTEEYEQFISQCYSLTDNIIGIDMQDIIDPYLKNKYKFKEELKRIGIIK